MFRRSWQPARRQFWKRLKAPTSRLLFLSDATFSRRAVHGLALHFLMQSRYDVYNSGTVQSCTFSLEVAFSMAGVKTGFGMPVLFYMVTTAVLYPL